jgi:quinol monooxygenase YgiN
MRLFIFARFHAREGQEQALEALLRAQPELVRAEPGCLEMGIYRSVRDPRLFWIHSRWADEVAFNVHADLPNTDRFIERVEQLIDHPLDVTRSRSLEEGA